VNRPTAPFLKLFRMHRVSSLTGTFIRRRHRGRGLLVSSRALSTGRVGVSATTIPPLLGTYALSASSCTYPANNPTEDRYFCRRIGDLVLVGLADGHGGFQCSQFVQTALPDAFSAELSALSNSDGYGVHSHVDLQHIKTALARSFERVDRDFIGRLRPAFQLGFGSVSSVGACTIAAVISSSHVVVANAGDCRAVVGIKQSTRPGDSGLPPSIEASTVEVVELSVDHNCALPREQAQLRIAHPDDPDVVMQKPSGSCYVKGRLQPTRSIGDAYLKFSEFNADASQGSSGRHIPPPYSPPYITAKPELREFETSRAPEHSERVAFLIVASDGLWDVLSNEDAGECRSWYDVFHEVVRDPYCIFCILV
jgi:pyruvate dehydrogenase phosphatase